jgi:nucleotide-binding universal stress UspA family protein
MSFGRILIALDDSAIAARAVDVGIELAAALKAQAALVYVVDPTFAFQPDSGVPAAEWVANAQARRSIVAGRSRAANRGPATVAVSARREAG